MSSANCGSSPLSWFSDQGAGCLDAATLGVIRPADTSQSSEHLNMSRGVLSFASESDHRIHLSSPTGWNVASNKRDGCKEQKDSD